MRKKGLFAAVVGVIALVGVAGVSYAASDSLTEWKAQVLQQKKTILDQRVKEGTLTKSQADTIYNEIKENQATCDGTGSKGIGKKYGVGFGNGRGQGMGLGCGGQGRMRLQQETDIK